MESTRKTINSLRRALAARWPDFKFHVHTNPSYGFGGHAICIDWCLGPTSDEVTLVTKAISMDIAFLRIENFMDVGPVPDVLKSPVHNGGPSVDTLPE